MSDEAPGVDAPGVGVEERDSTAVTSGEEVAEPTATADADAGAGEAAPASSGAEGGVGGVDEGVVDTEASGATVTALARADDDGASSTRPQHAHMDGACVPWEDARAGAVLGCGVASHVGTGA